MRRNSMVPIIVVAVVVLLLLVGGIIFLASRNKAPGVAQPAISAIAKPRLVSQTFHGCPASGDGGDPVLNTLKNRVDEGQWQPATVSALLSLTWPQAIERQSRTHWSKADAADIARNEGAPVQVEGYLLDAKKLGPESCNCHAVDDVDFHIWLADDPNKGREQSVVIEAGPRVRSVHPAWTIPNLHSISNQKQKVRISGWVMLDPEHPDQVGKTRGTIWEIHPVMQIETQSGRTWKPLDTGTTGVSSVPVPAAATAAVADLITPESTATFPSVPNPKVQNNKSVQITKLNFDGTKGPKEPDEYVEIANTSKAPVDLTDWTVQALSHNDEYKWNSYVLQPGTSVRVYTNEVHNDSGGFSFNSLNPVWLNSGDIAELRDGDGVLVSRYAYGSKK